MSSHLVFYMLVAGLTAIDIFQTVASPTGSSEDMDLLKQKLAKTHRFVIKRQSDDKPNFRSKSVDTGLIEKLAHAKLGSSLRFRRDEKKDALKQDLETAEIESAAAALDAESAEENSIEALIADTKLKDDIAVAHNSHSSVSSKSQRAITKDEDDTDDDEEDDDEEEEDDEDEDGGDDEEEEDDDRGHETIVEDDGVKVESIEFNTEPKHSSHDKSNQANKGSGSTKVCKGLLDFKLMSDGFRSSLKTLIEREEEVVERLEQLEKTWERDQQKPIDQKSHDSSNNPVVKACVYIDQHGETDSKKTTTQTVIQQPPSTTIRQETTETPKESNSTSVKEFKVMVFTADSAHPSQDHSLEEPEKNDKIAQFDLRKPSLPSQPTHGIPIFEARVHTDEDRSKHRHRQRVRKRLMKKTVRESEHGDEHKQHANSLPAGDIDLENILWLKPSDFTTPNQSTKAYQSALKEIYKNGQDVLIIPINARFRDVREVKKGFLSSFRRLFSVS